MRKLPVLVASAALASAACAGAKRPSAFRVSADRVALDVRSEAASVSGRTLFTTCTNDFGRLHWSASGEGSGRRDRYVELHDMRVRLFDVPVLWLPWWYQPLDTDYGWRAMPGYTGRWGAYLLTKYVYRIAGGYGEGEWGLSGSTRLDWRYENGVAFGQGLRWQAGRLGRGYVRGYYAWDLDADRYDRHWSSHRWNYRNWGSTVDEDRYAAELGHRWEPTERDAVRVRGAVYSDSHFRGDFLRTSLLGVRSQFLRHEGNEFAWEHAESAFALGLSASGPLNEFYGGTARLPELYADVVPQPVPGLPASYESRSTLGYYNRNPAKYGEEGETALPFRYNPGPWADYNTFRLDSYHRLAAPFKVAGVLSVVPRLGLRGTFWNETGRLSADGASRAGRTGDDTLRSVVEGGVTFAARGTARTAGGGQHQVEPYLDVLCQEAHYSGLGRDARPYVFDGADASRDWLDQFAGRGRNLPYSWYGATPGLRNAWRVAGDGGRLRTVLDLDAYAAVQLNPVSYTSRDRAHRLTRDVADPNCGDSSQVVPGVRVRWMPTASASLAARLEYDVENSTLAFGEAAWRHRLDEAFSYYVRYAARDFRWWDYSSTPSDGRDGERAVRSDDFNLVDYQFLEAGCEQELCDAFAWGPFVRWDCRAGELDEVGGWIDFRTDCLGFRLELAYENDYLRIDGSRSSDDFRAGFYVYLRCAGPGNGSPFGGKD